MNDLFVSSGSRHQGIASLLLERAAAFAKETGAVRLSLATNVANLAAQALYERQGWKKDTEFFYYHIAAP